MDTPLVFGGSNPWSPQNFDHKFNGPTLLRTGLIQSRNIVSIRILQRIGVDYAIRYAQQLGITSPLYPNLSLALGSSGVSLAEMVTAYNCFNNGGNRVLPFYITKITDRLGRVIYLHQPQTEPVIAPNTAYIMTHLLEGVVKEGTGWRLKALGRPVAGKTGTTNDFRDAWFIGLTPQVTAGVWVGLDNLATLGSGRDRGPGGQSDSAGIPSEGPGQCPGGRISSPVRDRFPTLAGSGRKHRFGSLQGPGGEPCRSKGEPFPGYPKKTNPLFFFRKKNRGLRGQKKLLVNQTSFSES